jgi:hypothetical protein
MKNYKYFLIELVLALLLIGSQLQAPAFADLSNADCPGAAAGKVQAVAQNCIVTKYIKPGIQFLSVGVGVIVLAMVIVGAIQYSASSGNPQTVGAAKKKIINAIIALLLYAFLFAFLNFIIPGGLIQL